MGSEKSVQTLLPFDINGQKAMVNSFAFYFYDSVEN